MNNALIRRGFGVVAATSLVIAAFAALDDINLKRRPKVGDVAEYSVDATFDTEQGAIKFTEKEAEKIVDVSPDGTFKLKVDSTNVAIDVAGQTLPPQPDSSYTSENAANGSVKSISATEEPGPATYRIAHLNAFQAPDGPVKVGDTFKYDIAADKTHMTPGVHAEYTVAGVEKVKDWDTAKLTYSIKETEGDMPSSVTGTAWVSTVDGSIVKLQAVWTNVQPQGVPVPLSGKYNVDRTK